MKYVSYKHRKSLVADLKPIYTACSEEQAMQTLESFENITKKWTMPIQNWNTAIAHFMIKFEDRTNLN